jgi:glycosyltransferase involved in cell wall biosynthesis
MRRQNPDAGYALLTNGVELDTYTFGTTERSGILFAGKLDVWANHQMACSIIRDILPAVRREIPGTPLSVVGSRPASALQRLEGNGVEIHPNVPSFTPYLHGAEVFLHPHKGASGIQNKVLQAMACGCPVVTTPTGIQGIDVRHGEEVMIARSQEEFTRHVITLLREPALAERLARNARLVVERNHSWEAIDTAFDGVLESLFPEMSLKTEAIPISPIQL